MIGSEAVAKMRIRLMRGTAPSANLDALILSEMQAAQIRLEQMPTLPDFLITEGAWQVVTPGDERVAIPDDFIRENETDEMQLMDVDSLIKWPIKKGFYDDIRMRYDGESPARPQRYTLSGGYFRLRPVPPTPGPPNYRLWMTYYGKDVPIALDAENKWMKNVPDIIQGEAGVVIATSMGNAQALALFTKLLSESRSLLTVNTIAREMANFDPNPED